MDGGGKLWGTFIAFIVLLLVLTAALLGLTIPLTSGTYVNSFPSTPTKTMTKFEGSSFFPYSGTWDSSSTGQTADQCIDTCTKDGTCRGFFYHTALSNTLQQNTCYFYRNNNVQSLVGSNVVLSQYFVDTALVMGVEQPASNTDVYIKDGQAFKMFRSSYAAPTIA